MAKQREVKQWITVNGKHVPIFEGESKADALKRAVGKGGDKKETKDTSTSKAKAAEDQKNTDSKEETVEDKKKAQKDKFFNDPYMQKAMKKAGVTREDWESGKVSDSQKYDISNEAYKMEDRAEKRAAKKTAAQKQIDKDNDTKEKQIAENEKQKDSLNGKKSDTVDWGTNSDGQKLTRPRAAVEKDLKNAKEALQKAHEINADPKVRASAKWSPEDFKRQKEKIEKLENALKGGTGDNDLSKLSDEQLRETAKNTLASGNAKGTYELAQEAKRRGMKNLTNSSSNASIDSVSKELKKADMDIGGSKYDAEEQAEAINYMYGYGSLPKARQAIVEGKHSEDDIKKSVLYKETEGIKPHSKRREAYERALKKAGLTDKTTSSTQKQISKDLNTKEKQIAQAKAESDKLNGKTTRKPGEKYKSDNYEEGKEYMIRGFDGRKTPIKATYVESYAEREHKGMFSDLKLGDQHNFRGSDGIIYALRDSELQEGDYSVTRKGQRTSAAELRKKAMKAGYSEEKLKGMSVAQLKKLLGGK